MAGTSHHFLQSFPVANFPTPPAIITVSETTTLLDTITLLGDEQILCAPVTSKDDDSQYVGIVDMSFILREMLKPIAQASGKSLLADITGIEVLATTSVGQLPGAIHEFHFVKDDASLLDVCKVLGTMNVHRVAVLNEANEIVNFITQGAVVKVLAENTDKFSKTANMTLKEVNLVEPSTLVSCPSSTPTIQAFEHMSDNDVSALPVLDHNLKLIGNLSVRSLRDLVGNHQCYSKLNRPVTEFIAALVPDTTRDEMFPAITCTGDSKLGMVLKKLAVSRIHRLYLESGSSQLVRIISLSDILADLVTPDAS
jgi:CBS domain-containing protein